MNVRYSVLVQWSDEDRAYVVSFPEWGDLVPTHGDRCKEVVKNGEELLKGLIDSRRQHGDALPDPVCLPQPSMRECISAVIYWRRANCRQNGRHVRQRSRSGSELLEFELLKFDLSWGRRDGE